MNLKERIRRLSGTGRRDPKEGATITRSLRNRNDPEPKHVGRVSSANQDSERKTDCWGGASKKSLRGEV